MAIEMATRRAFLATLAAAAALPRTGWAEAASPAFLAAGKMGNAFVLHGLSQAGESVFRIALPGRGHAAAAHPLQPLAVAFARRPGLFALVLDCARGTIQHRLAPPDGRQFNGHGAFSADGNLLMTSEVVADTSEGRIGLWETAGFARIGEWASGGIGPHEIRLLPDGRLVVANGGIQTDPTDRTKLNIDRMQPNLTLISADGHVADQTALAPEFHQNSIRHLALAGDSVAFAMQWEGDPAIPVPQLGLWRPGSAAVPCLPPDDQMFALQGYAGSIAATGGLIALTSPRGGAVMIFDADGRWRATHRRADACGVAPAGAGFVVTDGAGAVFTCDGAAMAPLRRDGPAWDNHLVTVG